MISAVLVNYFLIFVLVLVRIASMAVVAPLFSSRSIPLQVKIVFAAAVSFVVFPMVHAGNLHVPTDAAGLALAILSEAFIGLTLGFGAALVFVGIELAGLLIAQQMGTALADVFNPAYSSTSPAIGRFYSLFALVVFLGMNGHHGLLKILVGTFEDMPLMKTAMDGVVAEKLVWMLANAYALAFRVAAAVIVSLILVTVVLGIIARTVPQMNVLIDGFPIKVCLGLVVAALTLGAVGNLLSRTFERMLIYLQGMMTLS